MAAITVDEFRAICDARDFTTFVVHLKDGRRLIVAHHMATPSFPNRRNLRSFCLLEDPPNAREIQEDCRLGEIERIELRPDLPCFSFQENRWIRRAS